MGISFRIRNVLIAVGALICAGCWNGGNNSVHLGNVSIGQQMIDLKAALEQQAITQEEYDRLKNALMVLDQACEEDGE